MGPPVVIWANCDLPISLSWKTTSDLNVHVTLQKLNCLFNGYNLCIAPSPHKFIIILISGFLIKVWIVI